MVCIAAFIVFAILGIFSAYYRRLAWKAWSCVGKKVLFQPCDIKFSQEIKGKLLSTIVLRKPKLARFMEKWIDVFAFGFVVLTIWSLFSVAFATLNLIVYDTCDPRSAESCSLGGEACSVGGSEPGLIEAVLQGNPHGYVWGHVSLFFETVSRLPDRFRTWDPVAFTSTWSSFERPFDEAKPTVLEVIDPSCVFCAKLFAHAVEAKAFDSYNVTYILYPIPNPKSETGYKFPHSMRIARVVEALKILGTENVLPVGLDWKFLEVLYLQKKDGLTYQELFNFQYNEESAVQAIEGMLREIEVDADLIQIVLSTAESEDVSQRLAAQKKVVEEDIRTVKIPTVFVGERRFDRVIGPEQFATKP